MKKDPEEIYLPSWDSLVDRQTGLLTRSQNQALKKTRVLLLGLGGMGMNVVAHLARMGFTRFTLMDMDLIDATTMNRTPFAFDDTLGLTKVEATRRYLLKINPQAEIEVFPEMKLGLDSDPELMARLVRDHDVLSWAMDGLGGRIFYTRIAHAIGSELERGKPAVESWALPFHFCSWTIPNKAGTPTWEECFDLPTAGLELTEITPEILRRTGLEFFGRLAAVPCCLNGVDPDLKRRWLNLEISNRSLGPLVVGCTSMIAYEILAIALDQAGLPLPHGRIHEAPWMGLFNVRDHVAYEYNFQTQEARYQTPGDLRCDQAPVGK